MPERPIVELRLGSLDTRPGEISFYDLERVAKQTQRLVHRIGRSLVGMTRPGRSTHPVERATALTLAGLRAGSTILDVVGVPLVVDDGAMDFNIPIDLSDRSIAMWADAVAALSEPGAGLPAGFDVPMVEAMEDWLRSLRKFPSIGLAAEVQNRSVMASVQPQAARQVLREVSPQPSLPWVSSTDQALVGYLYQVNLSTGTFSIRDRTEHVTRISVPPDLRTRAAQYIGSRVRAIGRPEIDDIGHMVAFRVALLTQLPEAGEQGEFFGRDELQPAVPRARGEHKPLSFEMFGIPGLRDEEVTRFQTALRQVRETG